MPRRRITLSRSETEELERKAQLAGVPASTLIRQEIADLLTPGKTPVSTRIRLSYLDRMTRILRDPRDAVRADLTRIDNFLRTDAAPVGRTRDFLLSLRESLHALATRLDSEASSHMNESNRLKDTFSAVTVASLAPFTLMASHGPAGVSPIWTIAAVAAVVLLGAGIFFWRTRYAKMLRARLPNLAATLRGNDPGKPPLPPDRTDEHGTLRDGPAHLSILRAFRQFPPELANHIQDFLDQPEGMERLRVLFEDVTFEAADDPPRQSTGRGMAIRGPVEPRLTLYKLIPMTLDQYERLPPELAHDLLSRRSRPFHRAVYQGLPDAESPEVSASLPLEGTVDPQEERGRQKAAPARRRAADANGGVP